MTFSPRFERLWLEAEIVSLSTLPVAQILRLIFAVFLVFCHGCIDGALEWEITAPKCGWKPLPKLIGELNRHLRGWANYYRLGQPRTAFQRINRYVRHRLYQRLRRSTQRPWKPVPGQTAYGSSSNWASSTCKCSVQYVYAKANHERPH